MNLRHTIVLFMVFAVILATGCAQNAQDEEAQPAAGYEDQAEGDGDWNTTAEQTGVSARADIHDVQGQSVGQVQFMASEEKVIVSADLKDLDQGWRGFHLHQSGTCDPGAHDGAFSSAHGHYNPGEGKGHGEHTGDMPPLYINEDGTANMEFTVDKFTVEQLLEDGVAVMIHAEPDNMGHIPDRYQSADSDRSGPDEETLNTGDAGERVACGVLEIGAE